MHAPYPLIHSILYLRHLGSKYLFVKPRTSHHNGLSPVVSVASSKYQTAPTAPIQVVGGRQHLGSGRASPSSPAGILHSNSVPTAAPHPTPNNSTHPLSERTRRLRRTERPGCHSSASGAGPRDLSDINIVRTYAM